MTTCVTTHSTPFALNISTVAPPGLAKVPSNEGGVCELPTAVLATGVPPMSTKKVWNAPLNVAWIRSRVTFAGKSNTMSPVPDFVKASDTLGMSVKNPLPPKMWTALLSQGKSPLMKFGAGSHAVRRLQRALNAADGAALAVTGVFEARTTEAVKTYQRDHGLPATGVVLEDMWALLKAGTR